MSEPEKNPQETQSPFEFKWTASAGDKSGEGLQNGLAAFGKFLEGIAKMAGGMGGEAIRNGLAANWLDGVATSLEQAANTARETGKSPPGKYGEVSCFLERIEAEVKETKYEAQTAGFRQRLQETSQLLERMQNPAADSAFLEDVRKLSNIAGYFRAASGPNCPPDNSKE